MADTWYYARDDERNGPFSSRQLRDLADAGTILITDTIWKTGVAQGVPATRVRQLFPQLEVIPPAIAKIPSIDLPPASPPSPAVALADIEPLLVDLTESTPPQPVVLAPESPKSMPHQEPPARRRTASAGKGAIMMGQDGTQVKFKKQCTTCQHIDASATTMKITTGTMKAGFFCPKCKRRRECELRGH